MIVRHIKLPPDQDVQEFIGFMRDDYLPALRRGPTRIGQATYVELFQGNTQSTLHEFVLLVEGLMHLPPGFVGAELAARFDGFGTHSETIADDFRSVARWTESSSLDQVI